MPTSKSAVLRLAFKSDVYVTDKSQARSWLTKSWGAEEVGYQ